MRLGKLDDGVRGPTSGALASRHHRHLMHAWTEKEKSTRKPQDHYPWYRGCWCPWSDAASCCRWGLLPSSRSRLATLMRLRLRRLCKSIRWGIEELLLISIFAYVCVDGEWIARWLCRWMCEECVWILLWMNADEGLLVDGWMCVSPLGLACFRWLL